MRKATAIYRAPKGDNKVVEMGGLTFFDRQPVELNSEDHGHLIGKLGGNPHFDIVIGDDQISEPSEPKKKLGRPSNAEKAAKAKASTMPDTFGVEPMPSTFGPEEPN